MIWKFSLATSTIDHSKIFLILSYCKLSFMWKKRGDLFIHRTLIYFTSWKLAVYFIRPAQPIATPFGSNETWLSGFLWRNDMMTTWKHIFMSLSISENVEQLWKESLISDPDISTKRTITSHFYSLNIQNTKKYHVRNTGPSLEAWIKLEKQTFTNANSNRTGEFP